MKRRRVPSAVAFPAVVLVLAGVLADSFPGPFPRSYPAPTAPDERASALPAVGQADVRAAGRRVVAREVAAGRLSLAEAAARFGWLDAAAPPGDHRATAEELATRLGLADGRPYGDGDRLCLQVLLYVDPIARSECPDRADELTDRLRGEFLAARKAGGLGELPGMSEAARRDLTDQATAEANRLRAGRQP